MKRLIVKSQQQIAELWDDAKFIKSFRISTAANGLSCENNSFCTPDGKLRVAQKIGADFPMNTIFKARIPTGLWNTSTSAANCANDEDLVLTRILWLEGAEDKNQNTFSRYVYLHGTNHEDKLGTPASHGCIRFSNLDIIEVFENLEIGAEVFVE